MSRRKEIGTALGALACALGIGFVMQSTDSADKRYGPLDAAQERPTPDAVDVVDDEAKTKAPEERVFMDVQGVTLTSAMPYPEDYGFQSGLVDVPARADVKQGGLLAFPQPEPDLPKLAVTSCDVGLLAEPTDAAFVQLSLTALCLPNEQVTIHHNGMVFTSMTDDSGRMNMSVPALSKTAVFFASFGDDQLATAKAQVDDIGAYNRIVLQWDGQAGFELHARESGADYGAAGHIWRGTETNSNNLTKGTGGHLVHLGDRRIENGSFAEVYTFPLSMSDNNGQIDLSVEAQVTLGNCGLDIEAQTIEMRPAMPMKSRNVTFSVPGCDTVGDYLVLNNVFQDLKLVAR